MNNRQGSRQRPPPPMAAAVATAVHRDSHAISKPMISKPKIKIWHVLPPEIIHTDAANFRDLVQRLTGFQHTTTKSKPTTATASPPPPTSSSPDDQEACSEGNTNNTAMTMAIAIKDEPKQEEEEEQQQQQVERMFWMEESSLGFLRALEEDQNDHDHDQFFLHGFGDLHLLPFING